MTYLGTKFKVAMSNGLEGDAFTRNVTDGCTDGRTDRLWYDINIPFFLKKKASIIIIHTLYRLEVKLIIFHFLPRLSHWLMGSYCDHWMWVVRRQQLLRRTFSKQLTGF